MPDVASHQPPTSYRLNLESLQRFLLAENKSPRTIQTYLDVVDRLGAYLATQSIPSEPPRFQREHSEELKQQAVARPLVGEGQTAIAESIGIPKQTVTSWAASADGLTAEP